MDVPNGTVFSFSDKSYTREWCNKTLQDYSNTMTSGGGKTMGALAFSVVLMMLLGFTLLCSGFVRLFLGRQSLNLFLGRFNLYPAVRVLLRVTFVLFLPLLSTAFSLIKQKSGSGSGTGLLLMLLWMLLIELIRKKVQVMVLPTDGSSFSRGIGRFTLMDYADEAAHVLWAGYLVYSNIDINGGNSQTDTQVLKMVMVAMFAALWSLSLVKLVQRVVNTYLAGQSFSTARNPLLIASYMQHVIHTTATTSSPATHGNTTGSAVMEECKFVVAGESNLVHRKKQKETKVELIVTTPRNENDKEKFVGLDMNLDEMDTLVTIDKVWKWGQDRGSPNGKLFCPNRRTDLQNLCLSFSLFKMLRRRFEKYPMAEVGSAMARRLMIKGLLNLYDDDGTGAHRPFKVLQLELDFLDNYYMAADNVVMSQPILFFSNFALSMIFVPIYLVAVLVILISNGDVGFLYCTARGFSPSHIPKGPIIIYLSITMALVATLICIEFTEFLTCYFFSNWNTVRLVCLYGAQQHDRWLWRKFLYFLITFRFFVSNVLHFLAKLFFPRRADPNTMKINQVSILSACGPLDKLFSAPMYQATLKTKAKKDIINSLKDIDEETGTISLPVPHGMSRAETTGRMKSVTEIILAAHLATELFDNKHKAEDKPKDDDGSPRVVATTLSRYCMYLVAYLPALLPDDETWVSKKFGDMRNCLTQVLQQCGGCSLCTPSSCCREKMAKSLWNITMQGDLVEDSSMVRDAMKMLKLDNNSWDVLAYFWVKMLIYLAPSNDIHGHAKAVATSGGDLITYLWTFCSHAGITRNISDDDHTV